MSNIIFSLIIIFLLTGCQIIDIPKKNWHVSDYSEFYVKKDNLFVEYLELDNLEEKIDKWEYRKLPNYLQECYEKEI